MIWLITCQEKESYCGLGLNFTPEAYSTKELAEARYQELDARRGEYCGFYYVLEEITLDQPND